MAKSDCLDLFGSARHIRVFMGAEEQDFSRQQLGGKNQPGVWIGDLGGLCLYWVTPWLITSRNIQAPGWYLAFCVSLYAFGVFTHFASDMQKTTAMQLRPGELITTGMFARLRNPNYFGELLIYSGFGLLAIHWLPVVILLVWVGFVWIPRMLQKERVLAQLPGFEQYKTHSKLFIPFII